LAGLRWKDIGLNSITVDERFCRRDGACADSLHHGVLRELVLYLRDKLLLPEDEILGLRLDGPEEILTYCRADNPPLSAPPTASSGKMPRMKTKYTDRDVRIIRLLKRYKVPTTEISAAMAIPQSSVSSLNKYGLNPPRPSRKRPNATQ